MKKQTLQTEITNVFLEKLRERLPLLPPLPPLPPVTAEPSPPLPAPPSTQRESQDEGLYDDSLPFNEHRKLFCCTVNNGKNGMSHFCVIIIAYVVINAEHRVQDLYGSA